jgi:hypothetical protein
VDFRYFINKSGAYNALQNIDYFKKYNIDNGLICWGDNEIDVAPETIYHIATREPYPDWIEASNEELVDEEKAMVSSC